MHAPPGHRRARLAERAPLDLVLLGAVVVVLSQRRRAAGGSSHLLSRDRLSLIARCSPTSRPGSPVCARCRSRPHPSRHPFRHEMAGTAFQPAHQRRVVCGVRWGLRHLPGEPDGALPLCQRDRQPRGAIAPILLMAIDRTNSTPPWSGGHVDLDSRTECPTRRGQLQRALNTLRIGAGHHQSHSVLWVWMAPVDPLPAGHPTS